MYENARIGVTEAAASLWLGRRIRVLDARGGELCAGFLSHVSSRRAFVLQERHGVRFGGAMRMVRLTEVGAIVPAGETAPAREAG
jgi:hypothetical protein